MNFPLGPRTLDTSLPLVNDGNALKGETNLTTSNGLVVDTSRLPESCQSIPSSAQSLSQCALHEIRSLLSKEEEGGRLSEEEQDSLDDGFFLCDLSVVIRKLEVWRQLFPRIKPFFAVKCNPDKMVTAVLGQYILETGFDCASISEIKLALDSTTSSNPKRCIYANPQRAMSDLEKALELGVRTLTFDGLEELHKVRRLYETRCRQWQEQDEQDTESARPLLPEMVLRIVVPDGASSVPLGEKFGAPPARVAALTEEALCLGLPVVGVSFHCGSGCHDPNAYGTAIQLAKEAMDTINSVILSHQHANPHKVDEPWLFRPCTLLDIGGGFPGIDGHGGDIGRFSGTPHELTDMSQHNAYAQNMENATSSIAAVVTPLVDQLFSVQEEDSNHQPIQIISEPGRYFVEAAFALCSRIYSKRIGERVIIERSETDNGSSSSIFRRHYYIAQGVQGVFKDVLLCGESFLPIPLHMQENHGNEKNPQHLDPNDATNNTLYPSTIHGPSGEDIDVVCVDCMLPELENGDWLLFDRMGAYTLSIAASSGSLPIRYVFGGGILSNDNHE
eukprot:CAMPEP_0198283368 /NCGR_PEP_ID=MMETSP1449-20131203/2982_1 /TAXON_ID=420275 /ORGANISM="Attheya septentrionalis, Strain CCMP2084" /LENGTH=559 /DNA_ID=CAMNT_0043979953 /DNA_START=232 /DNA_END=1911 /DNA_ORIENTATION=-